MTVLELIEELKYYHSRYGNGEIAIVKPNNGGTGYDYGTVYGIEYYDEFYIVADFVESGGANASQVTGV